MIDIKLSSRALIFIIAVASGFVILLGWIVVFTKEVFSFSFKGSSFFHLMSENNLPTWFSSVLLLIAALLLALVWVERRRANQRDRHSWLGLSLVFFGMSLDETAMIHERVNMLLLVRGVDDYGGLMTFPWVLPGLIAVLIFGVAFFHLFFSLPRNTKKLFALSGIIYIGGGLLLEVVEGFVFKNPAYREGTLHHVIVCIQESMEIIGIVVFIQALLDYLVNYSQNLTQDSTTVLEK